MQQRLRGIDIIGLVFASVCLLEGALALLLRHLGNIFEDLHVNLPLTPFILNRSAVVVAAFTPMALIVEGALRRRSEENQVACCVVAIIAMIGLLAGIGSLLYAHSQILY